MGLVCKTEGCGAAITTASKRGWCRSCAAKNMTADPANNARRAARIAEYYAQPGVKEARARRLAEFNRNQPPEHKQKMAALASARWSETIGRPDVMARSCSTEAKKRAAIARSEKRLAWCPPELRESFRYLMVSLRYREADARKIIEAEIPGTDEHARRAVANSEFKQQLREERRQREAY